MLNGLLHYACSNYNNNGCMKYEDNKIAKCFMHYLLVEAVNRRSTYTQQSADFSKFVRIKPHRAKYHLDINISFCRLNLRLCYCLSSCT